jgi:hypothetical protein
LTIKAGLEVMQMAIKQVKEIKHTSRRIHPEFSIERENASTTLS